MKIYYHKRFKKHYQKRIFLDKSLNRIYIEKLKLFVENPIHELLKDHALSSDMKGFRAFSITGNIRVIYSKMNNEIHFYDIGTHNQVYKT